MRGDVYIGLLEGQNIRVNLDANTCAKALQHTCQDRSRKILYSGVILEELLEKDVPC